MPTESQDFNLTRKYHHNIAEKALGIVLIHKNVMQVHVIVVDLAYKQLKKHILESLHHYAGRVC